MHYLTLYRIKDGKMKFGQNSVLFPVQINNVFLKSLSLIYANLPSEYKSILTNNCREEGNVFVRDPQMDRKTLKTKD